MTQLTVAAIRSVLTTRSYRTDRPAVAELLRTEPEWLAVIARLLARLLRDRAVRQDGTAALWDVLHAFPHTSSNPVADAFEFGRALASELTSIDRAQLRMDLIQLDMWLRPTRAGTDSPDETLAVCLAAVALPG